MTPLALILGLALIAFGIVSHLRRSILLRLLWLLAEYPGLTADGLVWAYELRYGIARRRVDLCRWRLARLEDGALAATPFGRVVARVAWALR